MGVIKNRIQLVCAIGLLRTLCSLWLIDIIHSSWLEPEARFVLAPLLFPERLHRLNLSRADTRYG